MQIKAERGYIIPAVNSQTVDYVKCAHQLADSLRIWHPNADITIITRDMLPDPTAQGFICDSQMYKLSPYRQTIKLEADMLVCGPVDHWWQMMQHRDVVISVGAKDFYGSNSSCRYYRDVFDVNNLPDVYSAVTYWRLSPAAMEFWQWVERIFHDWTRYKTLLKFPDDNPSTDLVYAMAAVVVGVDTVTLPQIIDYPRITHMKRHINGLQTENWTNELVWEYHRGQLKINTVSQSGLFHYHVKDWRPND